MLLLQVEFLRNEFELEDVKTFLRIYKKPELIGSGFLVNPDFCKQIVTFKAIFLAKNTL